MDVEQKLRAALAGRYAIEGEVGRGGMGVVFRARDLQHARTVAIKVLDPRIAELLGPKRFDREARIGSQLQHPHIIALIEAGSADGLHYMVMPFVGGETLRARLAKGPLPVADAARIADQVLDALEYAHTRGIVHRDIKPENILLEDGRAHVADFGIARAVYDVGETKLTATGVALGTPPYMSPEQATASKELDARSDLYSLACVFYEMLSGGPPFTGDTGQEIISKHVLDPVPSPRSMRAGIPKNIDAAIRKALAKEPGDRFESAAAFRAALVNPVPVKTVEEIAAARTLRRRALTTTAIGALAAVTVLVVPLRPATILENHRVVVFPLATTASMAEAGMLGWEAALAIEEALEHSEPLKWLDGWSLVPEAVRAEPRRLDQADARRVAVRQRARYYLTGVVRPSDTSLAVSLRLYDADADSLVAQETRSNAALGVAGLALEALQPLLARMLEPGRRVDLTPLTDRRAGAIALSLQGDRAYRQARFVEALDYYKRAVAEDSNAALAAVKGAQAASWAALTDAEAIPLIGVALQADSLLPPKYRHFLHGMRYWFQGQPDSSRARFRAALRIDPEWAEAWMALGEVYYHLIPHVGHLDSLAEDAFRRAVAADSAFAQPHIHLTEIEARRGNRAAARMHYERFLWTGTDSTYANELRFVMGCLERGPEALAEASLADSVAVTMAARVWLEGHARLDCAEAGYRRAREFEGLPAAHQWGVVLGLSAVLMAEGRHAELGALLDSALAAGHVSVYTLYLLMDALEVPGFEERAAAAERLARQATGPTYLGARVANRWLLGLWQLHRGDVQQAAAIHASMDSAATVRPQEALFANALGAHVAIAMVDTALALQCFAKLHTNVASETLSWSPTASLLPTRILQVEVLERTGREAESDSVLAVLSHREPVLHAGQDRTKWSVHPPAASEDIDP